jgi:hypothetical protein
MYITLDARRSPRYAEYAILHAEHAKMLRVRLLTSASLASRQGNSVLMPRPFALSRAVLTRSSETPPQSWFTSHPLVAYLQNNSFCGMNFWLDRQPNGSQAFMAGLVTPGALAALEIAKQLPTCFLARHAVEAWGQFDH